MAKKAAGHACSTMLKHMSNNCVYIYVYACLYTVSLSLFMLLILPIILSRISHNFHPLFFIYSHAITYYSILFLKFDSATCRRKIAYGS